MSYLPTAQRTVVVIRIIARRMSGGRRHEHVSAVQWKNEHSGVRGESSREQLIAWLRERPGDNVAYVIDTDGNCALLMTRRNLRGVSYVQSIVHDDWTDALLTLPVY